MAEAGKKVRNKLPVESAEDGRTCSERSEDHMAEEVD